MAIQKKSKLMRLMSRHKKVIFIGLVAAALFIGSSLIIYVSCESIEDNTFAKVFADLLMKIGESIIIAGLIGGGIGGVLNFIFEEFKEEENNKKEKLKQYQEDREKRKSFRRKMQSKLQTVHDNVELARVLIKSHKSGRTYGEQIRSLIMPSLISLKDFKRKINQNEDRQLESDLDCLQVSLTYMIAYLTVLIEEFEANYLKISNLQNYQDALVNRMRMLFTEVTEGKKEGLATLEKKIDFLEKAEDLFGNIEVPSSIEAVWQAMEELDYLRDFIGEIRDERGNKSMYYQYFLQHYFHCNKIIRTKNSKINEKIIRRKNFVANKDELKRIEAKKNSDQPLTNRDSLTRKIMENELRFDFETSKLKK